VQARQESGGKKMGEGKCKYKNRQVQKIDKFKNDKFKKSTSSKNRQVQKIDKLKNRQVQKSTSSKSTSSKIEKFKKSKSSKNR
jgi:hypothetical protein